MPDVALKPQVYKDPRPKEYFDRFHERSRTRDPNAIYEVVHVMTMLHALISYRARALGSENVPLGSVILAPNHASFMDHFFTAAFIRRRVRFMAKSQMFKPPFGSLVYSPGGVFPVRRGHHDEEAFITSFEILRRGGAVVMYCEGGRTRGCGFADAAKPGIGRLALQTGVPVVPVAIFGSDQVRNWKRLQFPRVTVQYGRPFRFGRVADPPREQQQETADYIFDRIKELHGELARLGHRSAMRGARRARHAE
ncbi:MAG: 1-acyl-sn-glycerol-3-phosphate acyltransferase [Actinomycetota bacterium]|nr:1-acyl-sn-glycerol-3-phosphate acyltransferase [Actinomycetota bacterium]